VATGAAGLATLNPAVLLPFAGQIAMQSPRLLGEVAHCRGPLGERVAPSSAASRRYGGLSNPQRGISMTEPVATTKAKPLRAVLEIAPRENVRQVSINKDAMPQRGDDDVFVLLTKQVLDATKINKHTDDEAAERYNATIAAFHDIAPAGAVEGMLERPKNS
jgi:hypothetical protein